MRQEYVTLIFTHIDLISISVLISRYSPILISATIDSGATVNCINEQLVDELRIPTRPCDPLRLSVVDGKPLAIVK